jgi:hypothetical protein
MLSHLSVSRVVSQVERPQWADSGPLVGRNGQIDKWQELSAPRIGVPPILKIATIDSKFGVHQGGGHANNQENVMRNLFLALSGLLLTIAVHPVHAATEECELAAADAALAIEKITIQNSCSENCNAKKFRNPSVKALSTSVMEKKDIDDDIWVKFKVVVGNDEGKEIGTYSVYTLSRDIGFCTIIRVEVQGGSQYSPLTAESYPPTEQELVLTNATGYEMERLSVKPGPVNDWGKNILAEHPLGDGQSRTFSLRSPGKTCDWDFNFAFKTDSVILGQIFGQLDLCKKSKLTIRYDKKTQFELD